MSSYATPPPASLTYTHPDAPPSLAADNMSFDFVFPSCEPATPPSFSFDSFPYDLPYQQPQPTTTTTHFAGGHARSRSNGSVYSYVSTAESTPDSVSTRMTTPSRASPPIRQHGPLLLPKIRSQDQAIESPPAKRARISPKPRTPAPAPRRSVVAAAAAAAFRPTHARSYTNPETLTWNMPSSFVSQPEEPSTSSLLCSPVIFADDMHSRRASTCSLDAPALEKYGFPTYRQMPAYVPAAAASPAPQPAALPTTEAYMFPSYTAAPRAPSPLSIASTPDPTPSTTLMSYLTGPNPAPSLVRTISFPLRDPNTKHFWWDVRQIRPWTAFNLSTVLSLPGAASLLNCPVPAPLLPHPAPAARHPETEAALHAIYASHYLPKLNAALAISSTRPMHLSSSSSSGKQTSELLFTASPAGEPASAAAIFGGKPTARVVGLVRSFDRFNTGMRVEGAIKRVEYLRGLAALHHAMREHSCRYGFILTEIELVVVRNGPDAVPNFGFLEVSSVPLGASASDEDGDVPLTACLALWGLCMMAGDDAPQASGLGVAHWKAEIGAPAEGTRRKALPRDEWMPKPQLAEKREAKRARGWIMPEDPVGRKELGKRGVRYGAC